MATKDVYPSLQLLFLFSLLMLGCTSCREDGPIEQVSLTLLEGSSWENWEPRDDIQCGFLRVPEDHYSPEGKYIQVAFAIFKARNDQPDSIPVIALTGGPGGRSLNAVARWENSYLREDRDLIVVEQRGIGLSSPLVNSSEGFVNILAADLTNEEEKEQTRIFMQKISAEIVDSGQDPALYNTIQNAHDFGALMEALEYEKYYLSGTSYGTKLGMYIMKYYPEKVDAAILNAPAGLEGKALENRIPDYLRSLKLLFAACAQDPDCRENHPDLRRDMLDAMRSLEEAPITLNLVNRSYTINPQDAMYFLRYLLYSSQGFELAPQFIEAILARDTQEIKSLAEGPSQMLYVGNMSAFLSFQAYEEFSEDTPPAVEKAMAAAPELAPGLAWFQSIIPAMGDWHSSRIKTYEHELKIMGTPALIIVNEFDPVTPPGNTRLFEAALINGSVLRLHRFGHGAGGECVEQIIRAFLLDPEQDLDISCLE